jgi:hypothetical protein
MGIKRFASRSPCARVQSRPLYRGIPIGLARCESHRGCPTCMNQSSLRELDDNPQLCAKGRFGRQIDHGRLPSPYAHRSFHVLAACTSCVRLATGERGREHSMRVPQEGVRLCCMCGQCGATGKLSPIGTGDSHSQRCSFAGGYTPLALSSLSPFCPPSLMEVSRWFPFWCALQFGCVATRDCTLR